jgi:two-component system LytT family response regulator
MKTIIVEDNPQAVQVIQTILQDHSELEVEICGVAESIQEAQQMIQHQQPDLWLLDIRLKNELVFDLFDQLAPHLKENATLIFISAYHDAENLRQAIKASAFDFIYKPIDEQELVEAVERARQQVQQQGLRQRMQQLEAKVLELAQSTGTQRISVHRVNGQLDLIPTAQILYLEAEQAICRFYLIDGSLIASPKSLSYYKKKLLPVHPFYQISKQQLVHTHHIRSFSAKEGYLILDDGRHLSVSRRRRKGLRELLEG